MWNCSSQKRAEENRKERTSWRAGANTRGPPPAGFPPRGGAATLPGSAPTTTKTQGGPGGGGDHREEGGPAGGGGPPGEGGPAAEEEPAVSSYAVDSAPAAKILNDFGYEFIFSNASSDLVTLYYAKKDVGSQNVEFDTLPKGNSLYNFMTADDVLCFYVSVPEGYEPIISISSSAGNIYDIDELDAMLQVKWIYDH